MTDRDETRRLERRVAQYQTWLVAAVVAAVGVGLLYVAGRPDWLRHQSGLRTVLNQIGSLLIVAVALALLWDWRGRRLLAGEVMDSARIGGEVEAAGLVKLTNLYLRDVDWQELFHNADHVDIFFAYGRSWRNAFATELQALAYRRSARLRVILPDPQDDLTVERLAYRFSMTVDALRDAIGEAQREFLALRRPEGASVQVYFRQGDPTFSAYRFDDRVVVTLYSHTRTRTSVPTFVARSSGFIYDFIRKEIDSLVESSSDSESA